MTKKPKSKLEHESESESESGECSEIIEIIELDDLVSIGLHIIKYSIKKIKEYHELEKYTKYLENNKEALTENDKKELEILYNKFYS